MEVSFDVLCEPGILVRTGKDVQSIFILGSPPEIGEWDYKRAVELPLAHKLEDGG